LLISAGVMACLCGVAGATAVTLTLDPVRGEAGGSVYVDVAMDTGGEDVSTLVLGLLFDGTLVEAVDVASGQVVEDADKTVGFNAGEGFIKLIIYGGLTTIADGYLVAIRFDIASSVADGVVPLRWTDASATTPAAGRLDVHVAEGQIVVGGEAMVTVSPNPGEVEVGQTLQMVALSSDPLDTGFSWVSTDDAVATVSATGLVTGNGIGAVSVSAFANSSGAEGRSAVYVVYSSLIHVTPSPLLLVTGHATQVAATSDLAGDTAFTFGTSNDTIATVAQTSGTTAQVTAQAPGVAYITALANGSGRLGAAEIQVVAEPYVVVTPSPAEVYMGQTIQLAAVSTEPDDVTFSWTTDDPGVATVSASGLVNGLAEGTATITATGNSSGLSGEGVVTVNWLPVAPTNVRASESDHPAGILIEWDPIAGASVEYRVYRSEDSDPANAAPLGTGWQTETSYLDTSAASGGALACFSLSTTSGDIYYYWVRARNSGHVESDLSPVAQGAMSRKAEGAEGGYAGANVCSIGLVVLALALAGKRKANARCR